MRLLTNEKSTEAYDRGVKDRTQSSVFKNPYPKGSNEARQYYEGWCEKNLLEFERKF